MPYVYLAIAILAETFGTSCLKLSDGFSRLWPTLGVLVGYGIAFYFLSLVLRDIPTGVAYAIWSAVGIVLITTIGWLLFGQTLDLPAIIGLGLIVAGVLVLNLLSRTATL